MIKFFRQIRQNLLSQGKTGKYIKYAIGEIVLVVIGILIALQINNWNEYQKERVLEYSLLENISKNIVDDINQYEQVVVTNGQEIDKIDSVLTIIRNPFIYQTNDLARHFRLLLAFKRLTPNKSAVTNLIASGKINIIKNNDLSEQILEYYNAMDIHMNGIDEALASYTRNQIGPYLMKYDFLDSNSVISKYRKRRTLMEYHQDPAIDNLISFKINLLTGQKANYQRQIDYAKNLLKQISEELEKQNN